MVNNMEMVSGNKEYPLLSDEEIIELFSDIEALNNFVMICPPRVSEKTEGGVLKTQSVLEKEKADLSKKGSLVLSIGEYAKQSDGIKELKVGSRVFVSSVLINMMPAFMIEREGYSVLGIEVNYLVAIKRDGENG